MGIVRVQLDERDYVNVLGTDGDLSDRPTLLPTSASTRESRGKLSIYLSRRAKTSPGDGRCHAAFLAQKPQENVRKGAIGVLIGGCKQKISEIHMESDQVRALIEKWASGAATTDTSPTMNRSRTGSLRGSRRM
jgi:hypothetical protein